MKKLFFILILFLVACGRQQTEIVDPNFRTGTEGLEIKFQTNSPPNEIIERSSFTLGMEVKNKGATEIKDGLIKISGYGEDFTFESDLDTQSTLQRIDSLEGKSLLYPEGTLPKFFLFRFKNNQRPTSGKGVFNAVACYQYETLATSEICINGKGVDYLNINQESCNMEQYKSKTFSGQGAPIVITKIEEEILPRNEQEFDIVLTIYLDNKGKGNAVKKESHSKKCNEQPILEDEINKISIDEISFGNARYSTRNGRIDCSTNEVDTSRNDKIICRTSRLRNDEGSYVSPLIVRLKYGYNEVASATVNVKQISQ